ncbi:MAG: ExbD/TolR family protein [Candidatus Adiutrix sp.]|jgi:biopolymer transport protein ExbD|nr:ExbD/TolR family protein [Candidatus Adiutrix sp.]
MERELIEGVEDFGAISDINVTPFIDIMLVLLIIFMVTAPLMLGGVHVNLPKSGGDPMPRPENPAIVSLDAQNRIFLDKEELPTVGRHERFQQLARESSTGEVFVRGDGEVKYGRMMELMAELGQAGFARVTLVTDIRLGPQDVNQASGQTPPAPGPEETVRP